MDRTSGKLADEATHQKLALEYIGGQFKGDLNGKPAKTGLFNGTTPSATGLDIHMLWAHGTPILHIDDFESSPDNLVHGARRLTSGTSISDFGSIKIPAGSVINDHVLEQTRLLHADTAAAKSSPFGVETAIPAGQRDFTLFTTLALDVGGFFDTTSEASIQAGTAPTFSVILHDKAGKIATAAASSFSPVIGKPFFHMLSSGKNVTALHLQTLQVPLAAFTGIDLGNVAKIQVEVAPPTGHLFVDDIKLAGF